MFALFLGNFVVILYLFVFDGKLILVQTLYVGNLLPIFNLSMLTLSFGKFVVISDLSLINVFLFVVKFW